jgi:hypothetical protein
MGKFLTEFFVDCRIFASNEETRKRVIMFVEITGGRDVGRHDFHCGGNIARS